MMHISAVKEAERSDFLKPVGQIVGINVCVVKTRDGDYDVGLEERVNIAAFCHADLFVSIHLNSGGQASGAEVYYPNGSYNAIASFAGYNVSKFPLTFRLLMLQEVK